MAVFQGFHQRLAVAGVRHVEFLFFRLPARDVDFRLVLDDDVVLSFRLRGDAQRGPRHDCHQANDI